jgi:hypothetical protein
VEPSEGTVDALCAEPPVGWWSGNAHFGRREKLVLPATEGQQVGLLDTGELPGPPRLISVTLFRDHPGLAGGSSVPINADIKARVTYGSGGASNTFDMDWANGGSFAVQAHTLRIDALSARVEAFSLAGADQPYNPNNGLGTRVQFAIGATVGIDGVSPPLPPSFTPPCRALTVVETQQAYNVPEFARKVIPVMGTDVVATIVPANYNISISGDVFTLARYNLTTAILENGLWLPAAARAVVIEKVGAAPDARTTMNFLLGL